MSKFWQLIKFIDFKFFTVIFLMIWCITSHNFPSHKISLSQKTTISQFIKVRYLNQLFGIQTPHFFSATTTAICNQKNIYNSSRFVGVCLSLYWSLYYCTVTNTDTNTHRYIHMLGIPIIAKRNKNKCLYVRQVRVFVTLKKL